MESWLSIQVKYEIGVVFCANERSAWVEATDSHTCRSPDLLVHYLPAVASFAGRASRPHRAFPYTQGEGGGKARLSSLWQRHASRERILPRPLGWGLARHAEMQRQPSACLVRIQSTTGKLIVGTSISCSGNRQIWISAPYCKSVTGDQI